MGNNEAYSYYEATVIGAYDLGKLDKDLLAVIMEQFRDCDIDSGGKSGTLTKDGLDCRQVAIKIMGGKLPIQPKLPKDYKKWTPKQAREHDAYDEAVAEEFYKITKEFGWG